MTPKELMTMCSESQNSKYPVNFARVVQDAFAVLGLYQRDLARDFEVAESTVSRWAKGTARPHPQIQRLVISWISRRAARVVPVFDGDLTSNRPAQPISSVGEDREFDRILAARQR